jgi:hypothetical protein
VFERHRDWKLRIYRSLWSLCRQVWTGEKFIAITDDEKAVQFVGLNEYQMQPDGTIAASNMIAQMDMDIIMTEGPDTITVNEELMQTLSQLGEAALTPLGKVMIELSNAPNKERLLKMMDDAMAPPQVPPDVQAMQQRMAQLEEMLKASMVDEKVAAVENKRADTLQKLMTATTPQAQATDEFGNPSGPPPQAPDLMAALEAMQMFPLQFGQPLYEQMAAQPPQQQPGPPPPGMDGMMQGGPEGAPPDMNAQMGGQIPLDDPSMMVDPNQISQAGGLPIDPMV